MKILKAGLIILTVLSIAGMAYSETSNLTPANTGAETQKATSTAVKEKGPGMKGERGFKNALFGWTEIPKSIVQVTRDSKNPIWGVTAGTLKGVGKAFPRTVSGIADVATIPLADYDKPLVKPDELNTQIK